MQIRPETRTLAPTAAPSPAAAPAGFRGDATPSGSRPAAASHGLPERPASGRAVSERVAALGQRLEDRLADLTQGLAPRAAHAVRSGGAEALRGLARLEAGLEAGTLDPRATGALLEGILGDLAAGLAPALEAQGAPSDPGARTEQRLTGFFAQLHERLDGELRPGTGASRAAHARLESLETRALEALRSGHLDRDALAAALQGLAEGAPATERSEGGAPPRIDHWLAQAEERLAGAVGSSPEAAAAAREFMALLERMGGALDGSLDAAGGARVLGRALSLLRAEFAAAGAEPAPGDRGPSAARVDRSA
ncbi:MAG: hypothetical protein ISQ08_04975 [Planctomycetes bacterium]|nr:hypothetical protein [Planctomycetota bacterium]